MFRATGDEAATPRAKANLLRRARRRRTPPTPDEVQAVADLCVNCKMCRDECTRRVNIPKLMLEAKAAPPRRARPGPRPTGCWPAPRRFAALGSNFAPLANALLGSRSVRWLMEKLFGVSRQPPAAGVRAAQLLPPRARPG